MSVSVPSWIWPASAPGCTIQPLANPSISSGAPSDGPPSTVAVQPLLMLSPNTRWNELASAVMPFSRTWMVVADCEVTCAVGTFEERDGATRSVAETSGMGAPPAAESRAS